METREQRLQASTFEDPVELSGGPLAGTIVEGKDWKPGEEKDFDIKHKTGRPGIYRRLEDDGDALTADHCVWCGVRPA